MTVANLTFSALQCWNLFLGQLLRQLSCIATLGCFSQGKKKKKIALRAGELMKAHYLRNFAFYCAPLTICLLKIGNRLKQACSHSVYGHLSPFGSHLKSCIRSSRFGLLFFSFWSENISAKFLWPSFLEEVGRALQLSVLFIQLLI